mmetsp:Transcript_99607/g.277315  ORF Transcript_99607/g.277315 Transcript_99607/m.277315 type:complete len:358 (-) Transcript_99607:19-1092(-)
MRFAELNREPGDLCPVAEAQAPALGGVLRAEAAADLHERQHDLAELRWRQRRRLALALPRQQTRDGRRQPGRRQWVCRIRRPLGEELATDSVQRVLVRLLGPRRRAELQPAGGEMCRCGERRSVDQPSGAARQHVHLLGFKARPGQLHASVDKVPELINADLSACIRGIAKLMDHWQDHCWQRIRQVEVHVGERSPDQRCLQAAEPPSASLQSAGHPVVDGRVLRTLRHELGEGVHHCHHLARLLRPPGGHGLCCCGRGAGALQLLAVWPHSPPDLRCELRGNLLLDHATLPEVVRKRDKLPPEEPRQRPLEVGRLYTPGRRCGAVRAVHHGLEDGGGMPGCQLHLPGSWRHCCKGI